MGAQASPIADGLFTWPDENPRLIASREKTTGVVSFPSQLQSSVSDDDLEEILLSRTGTLYTWTSQQFPPPSPPYAGDDDVTGFEPYAVGYVELPEGILIEGRLTVSDPEALAVGQPMVLEIVPFRVRRPSGEIEVRMTFAFTPVVAQDLIEGIRG